MKNFTKLLALALAFVGGGVGTAQAQILVTTANGLSNGDRIYISGVLTNDKDGSTGTSVYRDFTKIFSCGTGKATVATSATPSEANLFDVEMVSGSTTQFKLKRVQADDDNNNYIPVPTGNNATAVGDLTNSDGAAIFTLLQPNFSGYSNATRLKAEYSASTEPAYFRVSANYGSDEQAIKADFHKGTGERTLLYVYKCISGVTNPFSSFTWSLKDGGNDKYYSTLYLPFDVTVDENTTAYTATVGTDKVTATPITTTSVSGNNGVLLVGSSATATITYAGVTNTSISGNGFSGTCLSNATAPTNCCVFSKTTDNGVGFYSFSGTLAANKAYITTSSSVKALSLDIDGEATSISAIETESNSNAPIYDLSGRRVVKATKGLYIQGGKKVFLK